MEPEGYVAPGDSFVGNIRRVFSILPDDATAGDAIAMWRDFHNADKETPDAEPR